jgi:hypothetical protein
MAFPTEFNDNATSIGPTNIKHPIITFRVIMNRRLNEDIGPLTNSKSTNVLHPDMHDNDPDRGRTNSANHETQFQPFIPGKLNGSNIVRNDDGTFTAYGQEAVYLKTQYADIANPVLEVTNSPPFTVA